MRVFPALAACVLLASAPARADVVCDWVGIAGASPDGRPVPPPLQDQITRTAPALVALAMFEIANSIDHRYRSYLGVARAGGALDGEVATVAGAHAVMTALRPEQATALDHSFALSLASRAEGERRRASIAWGETVAATVLKRRLFDGPAPEPYRPIDSPGRFTPPLPPVITDWSLRAQPLFPENVGRSRGRPATGAHERALFARFERDEADRRSGPAGSNARCPAQGVVPRRLQPRRDGAEPCRCKAAAGRPGAALGADPDDAA